jgi:hypothetical protein
LSWALLPILKHLLNSRQLRAHALARLAVARPCLLRLAEPLVQLPQLLLQPLLHLRLYHVAILQELL